NNLPPSFVHMHHLTHNPFAFRNLVEDLTTISIIQIEMIPTISFRSPDQLASVVYIIAITLTTRSEEHTSELQSRENLVCRLLLRPPTTSPLSPYTTLFRSKIISRLPSSTCTTLRTTHSPFVIWLRT